MLISGISTDQQSNAENEQLAPLPYTFAKRQQIVIHANSRGKAKAWFTAQTSHTALLETQRQYGKHLQFEQVDEQQFSQLLQQCYQGNAGQSHEAADFLQNDIDLASLVDHLPEPEDLLEEADEAPVIRLINALIAEAIRENVSDIHIEPGEQNVSIRFRIDGVLREVIQPDRALAPLLISRIKIMAKLDIAEKRVPQDGRISLRIGGHTIDVRVSTLPGNLGERIVLRLLDKQQTLFGLDQMGMDHMQIEQTKRMLSLSHGIILVTGPTGSGKTTTLYAMLNQLDRLRKNIITIEDPVEYQLPGISQTQVNAKVDLTFARGLRAILRQDPDVIMVGEIRDRETAEIAVQASLTGHLVISTLHTNTAIGAVTRLRDMGIEPFLLASSLVGLISQRLVRKLCDHCKQSVEIKLTDLQRLDDKIQNAGSHAYQSQGCAKCNELGYKGRTGVFEVINVDKTMQQFIHDDNGELQLEKHARSVTNSLQQNAATLVQQGVTSIEEALRVSRDS